MQHIAVNLVHAQKHERKRENLVGVSTQVILKNQSYEFVKMQGIPEAGRDI